MVSEVQTEASGVLDNFGLSIEKRIQEELGAKLTDDYPQVSEIRNLAGESTGYMRVYEADKLVKACFMSVNVMPGARYFNIHIHPETKYLIPRFGFEGMLMAHGSQVSMDIYPDMDLVMDVEEFLEVCGSFGAIYDEAKQSDLDIQPSRLMHMRGLCSPFFMNSVKTRVDQLEQVESLANRYFDEWLRIYRTPKELDSDRAEERWRRREHFAKIVMELDPDRDMIVQVYGEPTTRAIEEALMI